MSTHTEDTKEMTVEEAMKRGIKLIAGRIEALHPQYFLDEATYAHDVKGTMSVVEEVMGDIEEALTIYASQVREERDREIMEQFKALCTVNEDGDCKYFRDDIHERLLRGEKFVAQEIITTLTPKT